MGQIRIISPGIFTSIQDKGRYGYQQFGVPVSGVMDPFAYRVGNILVGNDGKEAVLEATMLGPRLEFLNDSVIAITGGDLSPRINEESIPMWKSIHIKKGDILSFNGLKNGCRSYIAFSGGIHVPLVMGSRSTYIKGKIGGYEGRTLRAGDIVEFGKSKEELSILSERELPKKYIPEYKSSFCLRVVLGPQEDYFTERGIKTFFSNEYKITNECDRMGFRLDGKEIEHRDSGDIISDGINFGAIQILGHGKPIIMMADRQTTGGYAKIGNVISSDLYKIAQGKPGDQIHFKRVSIEGAQRILKEEEKKIHEIKRKCSKVINSKHYYFSLNERIYKVIIEKRR